MTADAKVELIRLMPSAVGVGLEAGLRATSARLAMEVMVEVLVAELALIELVVLAVRMILVRC